MQLELLNLSRDVVASADERRVAPFWLGDEPDDRGGKSIDVSLATKSYSVAGPDHIWDVGVQRSDDRRPDGLGLEQNRRRAAFAVAIAGRDARVNEHARTAQLVDHARVRLHANPLDMRRQ